MSVILPVNINNIDDINEYSQLTTYEQDLSNSYSVGNFQIADMENYDLVMTMYENQYTSAIIDNSMADTSLNDISGISYLI